MYSLRAMFMPRINFFCVSESVIMCSMLRSIWPVYTTKTEITPLKAKKGNNEISASNYFKSRKNAHKKVGHRIFVIHSEKDKTVSL